MGGNPRKTISILATVAVAATLVLTSGTAALADPPSPGSSTSDAPAGPHELLLTPNGSKAPGAVGSSLTGPSGEGCYVRVYNAWLQGGGVVGTSAYTDCLSYEPAVQTRGEIWRSRWYGWQKMDEDPRSDVWTDYVSSFPSWYCRYTTHNWQGRSYHQVQWYNGTSGSAYLYSDGNPQIAC